MEFTGSTGIGGCACVLRNYSIFELKLCRNLTSTQTKNEFLDTFDSFLNSK